MLSGYKYIICTLTVDAVNLHPIFKEVDLTDYKNAFLLPIYSDQLALMASGEFDHFEIKVDLSDLE